MPDSVSYHIRALHSKNISPPPTAFPSEVFTLVVYLLGCVCEGGRGVPWANHGSLQAGGSCWLGPLEPSSSASVMPDAG